ncbi:MAG: V-type ATP synthase subunit D [Patescibacteria group bacterium]
MKKKINPTRQELLRLKKQLKVAQSGHKLLKNKLDSLIQEFLSHVKELQGLRKDIEEKTPEMLMDYLKAENNLGKNEIDALTAHIPDARIDKEEKNIMGVRVEEYKFLNKKEIQETPFSKKAGDYNLEKAQKKAFKVLKSIIEYATLEQKIKLLAEEIENTRRRVNSLEHVYIPEIEESQKYITQKLEEKERFERTVLMKLKDFLN